MGKDFGEEIKEWLDDEENLLDDVNVYLPLEQRCMLVDIVFCVDVTSGTSPIINSVKAIARNLYDSIIIESQKKLKHVKQLRVKVIAFRDYYCDGPYAMEESKFFILPAENNEFYNFVSSLEARGGGDEPENALEAIALAMKSNWACEGSASEIARNIIVVFTDASAHPFEKTSKVAIEFYPYYPTDMIGTYGEFIDEWQGARPLGGRDYWSKYAMDNHAKRMIVYAPCGAYPWDDLEDDLEMMIMRDIEDLTSEKIISDINSVIV